MHTCVHTVQIPWLAVADVLVEDQWLILCQNADCLDTGIDAVGKREVNNSVFAAEWNSWFCQVSCQNAKTAALSACKQHGNDFLFR